MLDPCLLRRFGFRRVERSAVFWSGRVFERYLYERAGVYYALIDGSLVEVSRRSPCIADFQRIVCVGLSDFIEVF